MLQYLQYILFIYLRFVPLAEGSWVYSQISLANPLPGAHWPSPISI